MVGRGGNKPSENLQSLNPNEIKVSSHISLYKTDNLRHIYDSYLHEKELNIKSINTLPILFMQTRVLVKIIATIVSSCVFPDSR